MHTQGENAANFPAVLCCACRRLHAAACALLGSDRWEKPTRRGPGQIVCLSSLLLFNYSALKRRGYLHTTLTLQEEISTAPFIMQSAGKKKGDS